MDSQKNVFTVQSVYQSLSDLELAVQSFADAADGWCQDDAKQALVHLLSEHLTQQFTAHQSAVFSALHVAEHPQPHLSVSPT